MEIKQYKQKIANTLIHGIQQNIKHQNMIASGDYKIGKIKAPKKTVSTGQLERETYAGYDDALKNLQRNANPKIDMTGYADAGYDSSSGSEVGGGFKINTKLAKQYLEKQAKKVIASEGKKLKKVYKEEGKPLLQKTGRLIESKIDEMTGMNQDGGSFLKSMKKLGHSVSKGASKIGQQIVSQGTKELGKAAIGGIKDVLTNPGTISEVAEGAGIKKERKQRTVSEKEHRRHALIRKIMDEKGCGMAQASKHIKENKLAY
jgi:hypothetical protein